MGDNHDDDNSPVDTLDPTDVSYTAMSLKVDARSGPYEPSVHKDILNLQSEDDEGERLNKKNDGASPTGKVRSRSNSSLSSVRSSDPNGDGDSERGGSEEEGDKEEEEEDNPEIEGEDEEEGIYYSEEVTYNAEVDSYLKSNEMDDRYEQSDEGYREEEEVLRFSNDGDERRSTPLQHNNDDVLDIPPPPSQPRPKLLKRRPNPLALSRSRSSCNQEGNGIDYAAIYKETGENTVTSSSMVCV